MQLKAIIIFCVLLAIDGGLVAQQRNNDIPAEARERLEYGVGKWRSETEYLDSQGNITRTEISLTNRKFIMDDRVLEISGVIEGSGRQFRAWEYFDVQAQKHALTELNQNGSLTTMKGDLGGLFSWESEPMMTPNGGISAIRFDHIDIQPNSFSALGYISRDRGNTWTLFIKQFLSRID